MKSSSQLQQVGTQIMLYWMLACNLPPSTTTLPPTTIYAPPLPTNLEYLAPTVPSITAPPPQGNFQNFFFILSLLLGISCQLTTFVTNHPPNVMMLRNKTPNHGKYTKLLYFLISTNASTHSDEHLSFSPARPSLSSRRLVVVTTLASRFNPQQWRFKRTNCKNDRKVVQGQKRIGNANQRKENVKSTWWSIAKSSHPLSTQSHDQLRKLQSTLMNYQKLVAMELKKKTNVLTIVNAIATKFPSLQQWL